MENLNLHDIQNNMEFIRKLPTPLELKERYPLTNKAIQKKIALDKEVREIFLGKSNKKLLIVGPCSIDYKKSIIKYLKILEEKILSFGGLKNVIIIPRVYTQKPRTISTGFMGLLHNPDVASGSEDIYKGIIEVRDVHSSILENTIFSGTADEMLYPAELRYISDCLSYVAIGARSVTNQYHRLVASGLSCPVGMKNPVNGELNSMVNSIISANYPHNTIYRGWEVKTKGNYLAHSILRGYRDLEDNNHSNYNEETINSLIGKIDDTNKNILKSIIIDCSHENSNKTPSNQVLVLDSVLKRIRDNKPNYNFICGFMIESYIKYGNQNFGSGEKECGLSYTDPCLDVDTTWEMIKECEKVFKKGD